MAIQLFLFLSFSQILLTSCKNRPMVKTIYDNLSSSEEEFQIISKKFKSPLVIQASVKNEDSFEDLKSKIVQAFDTSYFIPATNFNSAMCQVHGVSINHKTAQCNINGHKHKSLTRFLMCCKDVVQVCSLRAVYIFSIAASTHEILQKRIKAYITNDAGSDALHFIEALIVTMFPTKVMLPLIDFQVLFEQIYQKSFEDLFSESLQKFLLKTKTPNIRILKSNDAYSLVICPMHTTLYQDWGNPESIRKVRTIEKSIIEGYEIVDESADMEINLPSSKIFASANKGGEAEKFTSQDDFLKLFKTADLNIPKFVQNVSYDIFPAQLVSEPCWRFLRHNINFDDSPAFFLE